ncbi:hypothetical protein FJZ55_08325, partial [Candidatus Woesearchaeota archaeon]|nr:hypothetical protein [Candidatus Woesearchaeota archaeon]
MNEIQIQIEQGSVLGVNYSGSHDSSIAVVSPDGYISFACSLERITRRKQDGRFPDQLLELIDMGKIKACAFPFYSPDNIPSGPMGSRFHTLRHDK